MPSESQQKGTTTLDSQYKKEPAEEIQGPK